MPRIAAVTTAVPRYTLEQSQIREFARGVFGKENSIDRLLPVFDNALIDTRHFTTDLDWFQSEHMFTEVNDTYISEALSLSKQVTESLAKKVGIGTKDFDTILFVSTTGLSTPSIDARLWNEIELNPHIKRIPIWGLGCAGGVGAIARAFDLANGDPQSRILIISVELCGLAFQSNDRSKSNIVATALFADGAAACLVIGDEVELPTPQRLQPQIVGTLSTIYPDTLDVMGWRITGEGFRIVLSKDIPSIVTSLVKENICELLNKHGLPLDQLKHYITHPGGRKVLDAYRDGLGLCENDLRHSLSVLRENGNMSSATVFFILEKFMAEEDDKNLGEHGLISALGPGFSSELVLIRT